MLNDQEEKQRLEKLGLDRPTTRRGFLKLGASAGLTLAMVSAFGPLVQAAGYNGSPGLLIMTNAKGMILADPTRCVGCRRCEIACTAFNDGKSQPAIARVKVGRNYNFGPRGVSNGFWSGEGEYGNFRLIQETCKQCAHPVPCQLACPNDAIEVVPPVNARVVNQDKCVGCRTCQRACPWGMTSFDEEAKKATKCTLCDGKPECVAACPAGALQYIPWQDMTKVIPARYVVPAYISTPKDVADSCVQCHS